MSATTLQAYINGTGIYSTIREDWNNKAPMWAFEHDRRHFKVQLRHNKKSMTLWFYQGLASREPDTAVILECIVSDYSLDYESVNDYIEELGLEIKSAQDFRTYEAQFKSLKSQNKRTLNLLGAELLARLQEVI